MALGGVIQKRGGFRIYFHFFPVARIDLVDDISPAVTAEFFFNPLRLHRPAASAIEWLRREESVVSSKNLTRTMHRIESSGHERRVALE